MPLPTLSPLLSPATLCLQLHALLAQQRVGLGRDAPTQEQSPLPVLKILSLLSSAASSTACSLCTRSIYREEHAVAVVWLQAHKSVSAPLTGVDTHKQGPAPTVVRARAGRGQGGAHTGKHRGWRQVLQVGQRVRSVLG